MKAGYLQFNPVLGDPDQNILILEKLIAGASGADLLVLPELSNSGYNFESKKQAVNLAEEVPSSRFVEFLLETARRLNLFIVSGFNEKEGAKIFNSSVLVGPKGIIGRYRKIHLFMNEFDFFEKGDKPPQVFDLGFCQTGILICFDWVFPEVWRILALKGAEVICHPSNLVLPHAQKAVPVQCLMNRVYTITANRYGTEREISFSGKSFIAGPSGEVIRMAPGSGDEVAISEIDPSLSRNKKLTPRNDILSDRRTELYRDII